MDSDNQDAGNLVIKGNQFTINDDTVTFTATSGDEVEYWQYIYDLLNKLTKVSKNGVMVGDYEYSPDGLREVKRASNGTIHYVFEGTEPIFEKRIADGKIKSYVYALGKHLARVDGVIGDSTAKMYYYHTDNVGSVKAVTDQTGKVVFNADYFTFGTKYTSNGDFDETHGFTGKEYDGDTGLYYYDARWYDSEIGRFISEDPAADVNNPNLYSYCANNPLNGIDPTGLYDDSGETNWDNGGYEGYTATDEDMAGAGTYDNSPDPTESTTTTDGNCTVTENKYDDGSLQFIVDVKYDPVNGITKETCRNCTFDSEGNLLSQIDNTTFSKNGYTVEIDSFTAGNVTSTSYEIKDSTGKIIDVEQVTDISLIGCRDWGWGGSTHPIANGKNESLTGRNKYDDLLMVVTNDGRIGLFGRCNFESTDAKGWYNARGEQKTLTGKYADIENGPYTINYGYHFGSYPDLWVNNGGRVNIQQKSDPWTGKPYMEGCEIHKGGSDWTWSQGCITVFQDDWNNFMSYFDQNPPTHDSKGNFAGGAKDQQQAGTLFIF